MTTLLPFPTLPWVIAAGLWLTGLGLLAYVAYQTGAIQAYVNFWREAAKNSSLVSAKRAVFIHGAAAGAILIFMVVRAAGWVFTKDSLSAFETFLYTTCGGYIGGSIADAYAAKAAAKREPAP